MKFLSNIGGDTVRFDEHGNEYHHYHNIALTETIYKVTSDKDLSECSHTQMDDNKCKNCCAVKTPRGWIKGSKEIMVGTSGMYKELIVPMVLFKNMPIDMAMFHSAVLCERCMNSLAYELGLDNSYPEYGIEWLKVGTTCDCCKNENWNYSKKFQTKLRWTRFKNKIKFKIFRFIGAL